MRRLLGRTLFVLAILWLCPTGGCTLFFPGGFLMSGEWENVGAALMIGMPGIGLGLAAFFLGRYLRRPQT